MILSGGPGQSAIPLTRDVTALLDHIHLDHDLVFVDQRGTGESGAVKCKDVSTPVGIVQQSSKAVQLGYREYLQVLAIISLSLALLNLLPLLPLDGGHMAFSIVEGIRGRAIQRSVYERVSAVGIALVLLLFFVGLSNDIGNIHGG